MFDLGMYAVQIFHFEEHDDVAIETPKTNDGLSTVFSPHIHHYSVTGLVQAGGDTVTSTLRDPAGLSSILVEEWSDERLAFLKYHTDAISPTIAYNFDRLIHRDGSVRCLVGTYRAGDDLLGDALCVISSVPAHIFTRPLRDTLAR